MAEAITVTVADNADTVVLTVGLSGDMLKSVYDSNDDGKFENAVLADMVASTIKGRITTTGAPQDLTATQVRTVLNVESGATADQTDAEIRTAVEAATDSNVFTDADHSKLDGMAASSIANVVEDTTPQLGGELDLNGFSVGGDAQATTGDGTTTMDWGLGNIFDFLFGAQNETFVFTNPAKPGTFILKLLQDSGGSRTVTWPGSVKWIAGTAPTLTTTGTTGTDIITFYFDGTDYFGVEAINFS